MLIVTVFQDRSWIVQHEPTDGSPPIVGTREDEHRILEPVGNSSTRPWTPGWNASPRQPRLDMVAVLAQAKQMSRLEPEPEPEPKPEPKTKPPELLAYTDAPRPNK